MTDGWTVSAVVCGCGCGCGCGCVSAVVCGCRTAGFGYRSRSRRSGVGIGSPTGSNPGVPIGGDQFREGADVEGRNEIPRNQ
ncbi:hypothetical protein [Actinoplanes rectilineatus]|uniref:hypothetical protein n=1 Tax=Actinoplanes rectilineatus TaxID=113571 RepID=UPI00069624FC|nr:hypothetical protein [Actinoplanes rectilineatus]